MSEDTKSSAPKARRPLRVVNPGPDSGSDDDKPRKFTTYPNPSSQYHHSLSRPPTHDSHPGRISVSRIATSLQTETIPLYLPSKSNPNLSSPSSTSSHAVASTPPPITPLADLPVDPSTLEPSVMHSSTERIDGPPSRSHILHSHPYHRNGHQLQSRPPASSSPTFKPSPTSAPETYTSPTNPAASDKLLIVVTTDSDRYMTVDITDAKNPACIRERIFAKLCVWEEEDQSKFSIYQTEIGAFAIGEALTDQRLFDLCQEQGDSKGSLKFFVSHSSAPVHEDLPHPSISVSPTVTTIPPPILPSVSGVYDTLRPNRRTGSRPSSLSSASEKFHPEVSAGYEASVSDDLDNAERDRPAIRRPPQHLPGGNPPLSPHNNRRPSAQIPRSISPISASFISMSPPSGQITDRAWPQSIESPPLRDRYGKIVPTPPPPLSPAHHDCIAKDDNNITFPTRIPHNRTGSDPAAEREHVLRASELQQELPQRQYPKQFEENGKFGRLGDGLAGKRQQIDPDDDLDQTGRAESWVVVPRESSPRVNQDQPLAPQEGSRFSPLGRPFRPPPNHKSPSFVRNLVIPPLPRHPPPPPPVSSGDSRNSPRQAGQAVPPHWTVTWKSADKSKSLGDLKGSMFSHHPASLTPGDRRGLNQLPMRANGNSTGLYPPSDSSRGRELNAGSGLPKSLEPQRGNMRTQAFPSISQDFNQWAQNPYGGRTFVSPPFDPLQRPLSTTGDALNAPSAQQMQNTQPSTQDADIVRPPRTIPPNQLPPPPVNPSNRFAPNAIPSQSAEAKGNDSSRLPPYSPASPRSNLPRERHGGFSEASSSTVGKAPPRASSHQEKAEESSIHESTLRQEDHGWIVRMLDGTSTNESTLIQTSTSDKSVSTLTLTVPSIKPQSGDLSSLTDQLSPPPDDDSESDRDRGTWKKRPEEPTTRPASIMRSPNRGPPLTVRIENASHYQTASTTTHGSSNPNVLKPPAPRKRGARGSTFTDMRDYTWAPRPPPEDVYERLEEFFPNHDLDKPVIEASSGGTSPTAVDHTMIPPPPVSDKSRVKSKKSIRIVAEEHKRRIDRTSRAESASISNVLRKRSTKLWGSRLEEVSPAQARAGLAASLPDSPSGGPKPIFKWVRGELIGKGTYGRVYLALNATTGEMIAVKQVEMPRTASDKNDSRQETVVQALKIESETLKDLDHPNIVQYLGFEETPNFLSIFLEYVPGGSIGSCLQKHGAFDEDVTKSFMSQILGGLEYLHSKNILHRDLKADNILVETSGVCKISDFGISKRTDDISGGAHTAMQGTVFWMAPEVLNAQKKGYNFKIDIWSIGCVILEMWAGSRPWVGEDMYAVMYKLYQAQLPPPIPEGLTLSALADDFRLKCFAINPEERPTAAQLRRHQYLALPPGWVFNGFK